LIVPSDAGPADVRFDVHSQRAVHPISPYIYGGNQSVGWDSDTGRRFDASDWIGKGRHMTLTRLGGNRLTAYNWESNASNAGSDYEHSSDGYLLYDGTDDSSGDAVRGRVTAIHAQGAAYLVTIPIQGLVAADMEGPVSQGQVATRFYASRARKPGGPASFRYPPDQTDDVVYQDEFVAWLEARFPRAHRDPVHEIFYCLDNEPGLWPTTHPLIHPAATRYQEMAELSIEYARAIKDVAPTARVFGAVAYGWNEFENLQNAPDADGNYLAFFLDRMRSASESRGARLLDVLDLHWYPEAEGDTRITDQSATPEQVRARVQAPRSLWDPSYREQSWISDIVGEIRLLPRLKDLIDQHYPGTRLAFTEYYYGAGDSISGGVAQADVLGIFGREDVFAATLWSLGSSDSFIQAAFDMFTSYDGRGAGFGDTSVAATSSDHERASIYASVDQGRPDRMVLVAINKAQAPLSAAFSITTTERFGQAEVFELTAQAATPRRAETIVLQGGNAFVYELKPMSVTTVVLLR
jgi:hypothetical protein